MCKYIGAHVSAAGGVQNTIRNASQINTKAFGMFVKNQRQWNAKPLDKKTIEQFKMALIKEKYNINYILPHAGYLINLGNPDEIKRGKSINSFIDELNRCNLLGLKYLNIHPGSHLREISESECIKLIANSINFVIERVESIIIVLENTAGQGSNLGYSFRNLADIIEQINDKSRIGVCFDTCHAFAAGYDLKTIKGYESTFREFEKIIGLEYLKGIHLNDSKFVCGSKKDRHQSIGKGKIGISFFKRFMNDSRFDNMPIILETIDPNIWKEEIKMLYNMID